MHCLMYMQALAKINTVNTFHFLQADHQTMADITIPINDTDFEQTFKTYFKALHAYALSIIKEDAAAEEIVQNIFYKLWEKKNVLQIDHSIKAYLYRAVHNESMNVLKHKKVKSAHYMHTAYHMKNETDNAAKKILTGELEARLQRALNKLPQQCRTIFQMSRFEDLKYREIAAALNLSVKTIENQMGKALKIMRAELAEFLTVLFILMLT